MEVPVNMNSTETIQSVDKMSMMNTDLDDDVQVSKTP